jgi:hypothetical protein
VDAGSTLFFFPPSPKSVKILQSSQRKRKTQNGKGRIDFITLLQSCPRVKNSFERGVNFVRRPKLYTCGVAVSKKKEFRSHITKFADISRKSMKSHVCLSGIGNQHQHAPTPF